MSNNYDAIVLGGGAFGSASAYFLAKSGQRVLLLEQFEFDHQKGSSHGHSRIIRYAYDHPQYVELAKAAYPMWRELEREADEQLYVQTGGIDFGPGGTESLQTIITTLGTANISHEILDASEATYRFPQFRFDDDSVILFQQETGILSASRCVLAHLRLAERYGATLVSGAPVSAVQTFTDGVIVKTNDETYSASKLIITAGSWAKSILRQLNLELPLTIARCQEMYFNAVNLDEYAPNRFPAFIAHLKSQFGRMPYGIASHHDSGVKICWHGGNLYNHPSEINYQPDSNDILNMQSKFISHYLPELTGHRSSRVCLYTMTPDEHWIIDKHPEFPHVIIGGGGSGHAFKFSNLIGKILADLALKGNTDYDISLFRVSRFQ
ncbi:MAG: N-methyl-L-tryptophan oxidase [Anaerolineae bacterium]